MRFDGCGLNDAAAIDFGASNTDAAVVIGGTYHAWTRRSQGVPTPEMVQEILDAGGVALEQLTLLAVTGGRHMMLPDFLEGVPVVKVGELRAIARGGQALAEAKPELPPQPLLVVSAGSGTAMVAACGGEYRHVTGSGVGGGTMLGLGRLLLGHVDPVRLDQQAQQGDPNGADLALRDVVEGPIGSLPGDATAMNFGRVARMGVQPSDEDMAAALVTLVGQVVATLAINAARAAQVEEVVVTGHLTDMVTMRRVMMRVGDFFGFPLRLHSQAGYATVTGALLTALGR